MTTSSIHRVTRAAAVLFTGVALLTGSVQAEQRVLGGTHSQQAIKSACDKVGGINVKGQSGGYGCVNPKKGTMVACADSGVCTGYTPD